MSKSDSLQDIRDSMTDEDGYVTCLFKDLEIPFVNILRDFTVLFHDNMVAFHSEEYLLGTLSERAMNVFVDYKMFNIIESLKYLNKIYKSFLVKNNELKKDDIKKIEYHISKINKVYGELLIFDEDLKVPLKLEKFYDYFIEELDDKSQYYLFLVTVLNAYLEVADTIVDFITIYYYFSQDFITEQSVFYNNDFAKAFDDYFNQPVSLAHRNDFFKFTDYTLGNITVQKSKFVNYKSLKTNEMKLLN